MVVVLQESEIKSGWMLDTIELYRPSYIANSILEQRRMNIKDSNS